MPGGPVAVGGQTALLRGDLRAALRHPRVAHSDRREVRSVPRQGRAEIGCGIATDGLEVRTRRGAIYIGTDLTPHGIELARERRQPAIPGASRWQTLFATPADASIDHVYSFGVIHHSPVPEKIVREMHRVLRRGGTFTVMRTPHVDQLLRGDHVLRKFFRWMLLPSFMPRLIAAIGGFDRWKLEGHREMLKRKLTHEQW